MHINDESLFECVYRRFCVCVCVKESVGFLACMSVYVCVCVHTCVLACTLPDYFMYTNVSCTKLYQNMKLKYMLVN